MEKMNKRQRRKQAKKSADEILAALAANHGCACSNITGDEKAVICPQWEWDLIVEALRNFSSLR
jgi:hypothetical protein